MMHLSVLSNKKSGFWKRVLSKKKSWKPVLCNHQTQSWGPALTHPGVNLGFGFWFEFYFDLVPCELQVIEKSTKNTIRLRCAIILPIFVFLRFTIFGDKLGCLLHCYTLKKIFDIKWPGFIANKRKIKCLRKKSLDWPQLTHLFFSTG